MFSTCKRLNESNQLELIKNNELLDDCHLVLHFESWPSGFIEDRLALLRTFPTAASVSSEPFKFGMLSENELTDDTENAR